ncbi:signal-transducing adaptor protein 1 isoform X2 [Pleurodeles waltl]|uniref:signal-transducing adaptor protein 1 isoform X2 n=1 Tax=Pleurodeles waltl TaxID=8319 RepID=UPI0037093EC7
MAAPVPPRAAPRKVFQERQRITSLPLYYDGFLCVKRARQQKFTKYWAELRGTTLFLYKDSKQEMHAETVDLMDLKSLADLFPSDKQLTKVTLTLPHEEVQLKTETPEDVEEWKGFILTVTQLSVPSRLALLPGQIIRLREVLELENHRRASQISNPGGIPVHGMDSPGGDYIDVLSMPSCFFQVSRKQATDMLEQNPSSGNLILRPGGDSKNFSISIMQPSDPPVVKHYKVLSSDKGYTIDLERPIKLKSLDKVIEYFIKETRGKLVPYVCNMYDTKLELIGCGSEKRDAAKQNKPQATVAPIISLPVRKTEPSKKTETPVKPEKQKKPMVPITEDDPGSAYLIDDMPEFQNLSLGCKSCDRNPAGYLNDELHDILKKRREKMQL